FSLLVFFFSSRRRHTRSKRDWSSDVCLPICSLVLEDRCELIGLELCAQVLGQHHSPVPAGQGEREQAPTGHGLDGSSGHLGVGGLLTEEASRLRVLTATAPAVQSSAQEEPERDEQGQE